MEWAETTVVTTDLSKLNTAGLHEGDKVNALLDGV